MKLNILSDLHLGSSALDPPANDADVIILAGDISRPREAAAWALGLKGPVLYVLGNHEFYGSSIEGAAAELKRLCAGTHVVCNPRGYAKAGVNENPLFDPDLMIEMG